MPTSRQAGREDRLPAATRIGHQTGRRDLQTRRQAGQAPSSNKDRPPDRQTGFADKQAGRQRGQALRKADITGHQTGSRQTGRQTNDKTELSHQKQR